MNGLLHGQSAHGLAMCVLVVVGVFIMCAIASEADRGVKWAEAVMGLFWLAFVAAMGVGLVWAIVVVILWGIGR